MCIYCLYATNPEIHSIYFCLTPFVCEYNNWWQLKWDYLRAEADPLEAKKRSQESRRGERKPVVNQSGSGKRDSAEWRERRAEEATRERWAKSWKKRGEETRPADTRVATAVAGPRARGAAAAAANGGDYEGRHRQPQCRSSWARPKL